METDTIANTDELRAADFSEFVGQSEMTDRLHTLIGAALAERRPLEHVFLAGPAGFGKTTLATILAQELGEELNCYNMPLEEKALERILRRHSGVLLLDELHAATKRQQEMLLPLLEFGYIETKAGKKVESGWLTIIGCTTAPEKIIAPLEDRFLIRPVFAEYSDEEMGRIVLGMATKGGVGLSPADAEILGHATGGVPRRARALVLAGRALAIQHGREATAAEIMDFCQVDAMGLEPLHQAYLGVLHSLGGTAGLDRIANVMRRSPSTLMELERLLFKLELITYGERGRELTNTGYRKADSK